MKVKYILFSFLCLFCMVSSAQTLEQAKAWYNAGEYEKAKPVFEKLVKQQPSNGNYNFWYGVCCLEDGDPKTALKYLKTAVQKRIPSGQLYLAKNYNELYLFEDAIKTYETYIADLTKRKRPTDEAEKLLDKSKANLRMLKNVEDVCIIDSIVVDKEQFLSVYKISEESGKLYTFNEYFKTEGNHPGTVYVSELGNKIYFGEMGADDVMNIFSQNKLGNEWSEKVELPERINGSGNTNYPFMLTDGVTIYFASTGDASIGGYDIFVTRYNTSSDTYLAPENIGMPFNSPFNDYMYVIDEYNNLGWFASDRYQPEDKVCVYVFVPNEAKPLYNYESMDKDQLISLARIESIRDTWKNETIVTEGLNRLEHAVMFKPEKKRVVDFVFVIDDNKSYYQISDFKSAKAKELFKQYRQQADDLQKQKDKLAALRQTYMRADEATKNKMSASILDLEKRIDELDAAFEQLEIEVRNAEKQVLK